jgi:hypothetical protein
LEVHCTGSEGSLVAKGLRIRNGPDAWPTLAVGSNILFHTGLFDGKRHELANVLNALTVAVSLITTGNEEASRSEMLDSSTFLMTDILRDADVL